jgi:hypothetical protein
VYGYVTELCRKQAIAIQDHLNPNVHAIGEGEAMSRKYKKLKLAGGQAYDVSSD